MLAGARLVGVWHHRRAHRLFAAARWSADALGLVVLVRLPFVPQRAVCLPVMCRLWRPKQPDRTKLHLAVELVTLVAERYPDRQIHLTGDAAYAGKTLRDLPEQVQLTTRLRADAALYELAPPPTGKPGRPRTKGKRLPELIVLAALTSVRFKQTVVACYGERKPVEVACWRCLWYGTCGPRPVQVVPVRSPGAPDGYDLALVSTDLEASPAALVERYATRWPIEMVFPQLAKAGVGALGCDGQHVADLHLAVGDDHPVDEQLHQQPPLRERGRGQPVPDGLAEALDPVGDSAELQPLLSDHVQLALLVGQGGPAALQLPSLALELRQGDDLGQVGVQQPLLLALQLRDGLADGALTGLQLLR